MGKTDGDLPMTPSVRSFGSDRSTTVDSPATTLHSGRVALTRGLHWLGFWTAVCLPVAYLPALSTGKSGLFLGLLALQLFAFVVGHGHKQPTHS